MRTAHARLLMRYYWETIDTCVPAETILDVLRAAGFTDVRRKVFFGVQSEYLGRRP
jgi:demethylmenaquinone methyltransferase/2-methoxy-6-polyprenyl-1,4-benzoquinol methylase